MYRRWVYSRSRGAHQVLHAFFLVKGLRTRDDFSQLCGRDGKLVGQPSEASLPCGAVQVVIRSPCPPRPALLGVMSRRISNFLVRLS